MIFKNKNRWAASAVNYFFFLFIFLYSFITFTESLPAQTVNNYFKVVKPDYDTIYHPGNFPSIAELRVKEPKVALVLSGGGARGLAHVGVLSVFEKHKIPIDAIYGTSIGAVVGGLYAIGYTPEELGDILKSVDVNSFFSIVKDIKREYLYQDQKLSFSKSFFTLRFKNFKPVMPSSLSSGHAITNFINGLVLQGIRHTDKFSDLPIKFFPVATDLASGNSVTITNGNLSEALRASFTWPLLNPPIVMDSMKLVDGGILANIPAHFPKIDGYDLVISVNTTGGMHRKDEINTPWEILDQILSVMQAEFDARELKSSDIVITPQLQKYNSTSFGDADSIMALGEAATACKILPITKLLDSLRQKQKNGNSYLVNDISFEGARIPYEIEKNIIDLQRNRIIPESSIKDVLKLLKRQGFYRDVYCEIQKTDEVTHLTYKLQPYPYINSVSFSGDSLLSHVWLDSTFSTITGKPFNHAVWAAITDSVSKKYRQLNLSLAKIYKVNYDSTSGNLSIKITEGKINRINIIGNDNTRDYVILREFPMQPGDLFKINLATRGLSNISSTDLFETVTLDVEYSEETPDIVIKVTEKPSELMRFGLRVDNEKHSQLYLDFRDENLFDGGAEYGINYQGGFRNIITALDIKTNKIFKTPFSLKAKFKYQFEDQYTYKSVPTEKYSRWKREEAGEFREIKYGPSITFGGLYRKLGFLYGEYKYEHQKIITLSGENIPVGFQNVSSLKAGIIFDSQDEYPFPKKGMYLNAYHEFASAALVSGIPFTKTYISYEAYITSRNNFTLHPKIVFGFGDQTLPYTEQFKFGGQNSFFGLRDNEFRGRQIFTGSLEYRWLFPYRLFFDTFMSVRYDIGSVWEKSEAIKFESLRHALGISLLLDTPVGPAQFSLGNSFLFNRNLPNNPVSFGPVFMYFSLGYSLD